MGQNVAKLYTVSLGVQSDPDQRIFGSIQEAIDASESGSTIILSSGDHSGPNLGIIRVKSSLRFIGLQGAKIISPIVGDVCDVIFDNIIFKNIDDQSIEFRDGKSYLFRNCEFHIAIIGGVGRRRDCDIRYGFHLVGGSALLQNCIFCIVVENVDVFVAIGADCGTTYLSLQSPIIRVQYNNVCKLETFFFRGDADLCVIPYFEVFSSSIHYRTDSCHDFIYDGHCCVKKRNPRQCNKRHCGRCDNDRRCKQSHSCCDKKCNKCKIEPACIRLFRGLDCINVSINSTKIYFIQGKGVFNIAAGDAPIYVNALTASATTGNDWEVGDFRNILLTSFQSNLKCACEIKEYHCVEDCGPDDESEERCSSSEEESCEKPRRHHNKPPPCGQCGSFNPCRCPPFAPCGKCDPFTPCRCPPEPPFNPCPPIPLPEPLPIPPPCGANPFQPPVPTNCPPRWIKCKDDNHCHRKQPKQRSNRRPKESTDDSARYY